ncbi:MAG: hypothetical protein WBM11_06565 [Terriglobales bacterium]
MKRARRLGWIWLGLALLVLAGCSRRAELSFSNRAQTRPVPFDASHNGEISPTQAFAPASIPAGTAMVVRLRSALSSAEAHSGDEFEATLDGPIMVQGQTLVPGGAVITGRILTAKASAPRAPGYMRLTLSSVLLNGKVMDVHTSSIFSKGGSEGSHRSQLSSSDDAQFSTDRRLTFRLIEALPLQG